MGGWGLLFCLLKCSVVIRWWGDKGDGCFYSFLNDMFFDSFVFGCCKFSLVCFIDGGWIGKDDWLC